MKMWMLSGCVALLVLLGVTLAGAETPSGLDHPTWKEWQTRNEEVNKKLAEIEKGRAQQGLRRVPAVLDVILDHDGKHAAISYYQHPVNRPGTDWNAWVVLWDIEKNTTTRINAAGMPRWADQHHVKVALLNAASRRWPDPVGAVQVHVGRGEPVSFTATTELIPTRHMVNETGNAKSKGGDGFSEWFREKISFGTSATQHAAYFKQFNRVFPVGRASALSGSHKRLIGADGFGTVRVFDTESGAIVRTLRHDGAPAETFRVAAIQHISDFGKPNENRKKLVEAVRRAASEGANVVVLPETAITGYMTDDIKTTWQVDDRALSDGLVGKDPAAVAETVPGESTKVFGAQALELSLYITVPLVEVDPKTKRYYNTVVLIGPDGRIALHYRKRNPWPHAERGWATPGDFGNPVVDTSFGRLSALVCYDIHEQSAILAEQKVDTLLYSVAWVEGKDSDWFEKQLPALAKKHAFNIVAANWTFAEDKGWHGRGQSRIISGKGEVLKKAAPEHVQETLWFDLPLP